MCVKMKIISFVFLLLICSFLSFSGEAGKKENTQVTTLQSLELTEEEIAQVLEGLNKFNSAILQASQEIPRETFDPQAVVDDIGENMASLFAWVRDETVLVPYRGILRGHTGVLMDRCGNSLDRALLLHDLLRLAGHEARLAQGSLTESKAREILQNSPGIRDNGQDAQQGKDFGNRIQIYAEEYDISKEALQKSYKALLEEKERISKILRERTSEQAEALLDLVRTKLGRNTNRDTSQAVQDMKDHWWVQVEADNGWLDLDPTTMDAEPGETLTSVENTWDAEALDEDMFHLLTIRIIVERWEDADIKEETVCEHDLIPSNHIGERIELRHDPLGWPKDEVLYDTETPIQNLKETVMGLKEWIPVLRIGSEDTGTKSFTAAGTVNEKPGEKPEREGGGIAGGLMGAFGGSRKDAEDRSMLTAEWIEFEIRSPGRSIHRTRRAIFDLLGQAKRTSSSSSEPRFADGQILERNLSILGQTEILPMTCKISPEFTEFKSATEMLSAMEVLLNLVKDHATLDNSDIIARLGLISPLPGPLFNLALARFGLSRFDRAIYLDSLNLFCLQTFLQPNSAGGLDEFQQTDIVLSDVAVHPESKEDPFLIRLEQGVLETNAEVGRTTDQIGTDNTALLFAQAEIQGVDWVFIPDAADPALQKAQLTPETQAFIEQDLADGYAVIIPQKPIQIDGKPATGWWRIDPRSGTTIGMSGRGSGQAMSQYVRSVNMALQLKAAIQIHAGILRCWAAAITSPLRGNRPQNDRLTLRCIWVAVCSNVQRIAKGLMNIDINWTNIIISETINWGLKSLCENLWDEVIEE
jgi:hypothetical protein